MDVFLQQVVNGLSQGAIYALIAVGYTMVYGVLRLINFAHGEIFMVGAVVTLFSAKVWLMADPGPAETSIWQMLLIVAGALAAGALAWLIIRRRKVRTTASVALSADLELSTWTSAQRVLAFLACLTLLAALLIWRMLRWRDASYRDYLPTWLVVGLALLASILLALALSRLIELIILRPKQASLVLGSILALVLLAAVARHWIRPAPQTWARFLLVLLVSMIGAGLLGLLIELIAYRPLRSQPRIYALITAIGVSLLLQFGFQSTYLLGPNPEPSPVTSPQTDITPRLLPGNVAQPRPLMNPVRGVHVDARGDHIRLWWLKVHSDGTVKTLEVLIRATHLLIFVLTIVLMLVLRHVVLHTKTGLALRAVSFRFDTAALMGININRIVSFTFVIGSVLAGAAGTLYSMAIPQVDARMGFMMGLKAFIAAVVGGIGNIPGAVAAAFLLGLTEALTAGYAPNGDRYQDAIAFAVLIVILLVKPSGLFGSNVTEKV